MSPEEWNYPVADKEMLSVIRSLEQWHHYLEGAKHEFEIWNDHANLQWFMKRLLQFTFPLLSRIRSVAHAPPAMVLFFLFLFLPITFAFMLTAVAVLYKPGCAVSAADTSSV